MMKQLTHVAPKRASRRNIYHNQIIIVPPTTTATTKCVVELIWRSELGQLTQWRANREQCSLYKSVRDGLS